MNDPQDIYNAWRAFIYIINIPFIIFLLYVAINAKEFEKSRHKSSKYQPTASSHIFIRIVCVVTAIYLAAVLISIPR